MKQQPLGYNNYSGSISLLFSIYYHNIIQPKTILIDMSTASLGVRAR